MTVVRLGDVCEVLPGYAFKSSDWQDAGIAVVKIKKMRAIMLKMAVSLSAWMVIFICAYGRAVMLYRTSELLVLIQREIWTI